MEQCEIKYCSGERNQTKSELRKEKIRELKGMTYFSLELMPPATMYAAVHTSMPYHKALNGLRKELAIQFHFQST